MYTNVILSDGAYEHGPHVLDRLQGTVPGTGTSSHRQASVQEPSEPTRPELAELEIVEDRQQGVFWQCMAPSGRPSFTPRLLKEIRVSIDYLRRITDHEQRPPFQYMVTASRVPEIYNLGGDLRRFVDLISAGDREGLLRYAHACIDVVHKWGTTPAPPICAIALVQGDALGGGFECALACDVIIAERRARFGLPEVLFGLFPGMGAYSFLSRRVSPAYAERLILSGQVYTAEEMHEAGIVDVLVEDGEGEQGVYDFIRRERKQMRTRRALHRIRERVNPVTRSELLDITELWVDTALTLSGPELRKMKRLAQAQDRRVRVDRQPAA